MKTFAKLLMAVLRALVAPLALYAERNLLFRFDVTIDPKGRVGGKIPTLDDLAAYAVNYPDRFEVIKQPLYDHEQYPTAGQPSLTFFQNQIGQGQSSAIGAAAGAKKSIADTNMTLAGQIPSGMNFMCLGIEIEFTPGSVSTASTFTQANVASAADVANNAAAVALVVPNNDIATFYRSGAVRFNIFQKTYLLDAPIGKFPPMANLDVNAALAADGPITTKTVFVIALLNATGPLYTIEPALVIPQNQNFDVTLLWPAGAVATPSGFNARVGMRLLGYTYRNIQ